MARIEPADHRCVQARYATPSASVIDTQSVPITQAGCHTTLIPSSHQWPQAPLRDRFRRAGSGRSGSSCEDPRRTRRGAAVPKLALDLPRPHSYLRRSRLTWPEAAEKLKDCGPRTIEIVQPPEGSRGLRYCQRDDLSKDSLYVSADAVDWQRTLKQNSMALFRQHRNYRQTAGKNKKTDFRVGL